MESALEELKSEAGWGIKPKRLPPNKKAQKDRPLNAKFKKRLSIPTGAIKPFPKDRFLYFVSMLSVQTRDFGLRNLELLGSQLYILDEICQGISEGQTTFVILKSRQLGASTFFLALDLFWAFENRGLLGAFATHDEGSRDQFRNQIELFLQTLPKNFKVPYETSNRLMLVLKNTSLFRYLIAGSSSKTNKLGRSGGCNYLHATEVAFWGSQEDIKSLNQTLSERYPSRLYIYESTANGFNHYADMWEIASNSPAQRAIFVGWWRNELNEFAEDHPLYLKYMPQGRKTPLNPLEQRRIQIVRDTYDFKVTAGQIAWYRHHLETKCSNDQAQMDQEQPWTADDAFVSTGSQFFTDESLTNQLRQAKKFPCMPFVVKLTKQWAETDVLPADIFSAQLKIWEEPSRFGKYVIGCDPAYGSSPEADQSVVSVFRCYADKLIQVAEFSTPSASTYQCAWVLCYLAGLYVDVMVNLELTGPGTTVMQEIDRLREESMHYASAENASMRDCLAHIKHFLYRRPDSISGGIIRQWRTSYDTKRVLMHRHKDMIELGQVEIRSLACLDEHRKITIDGGTIQASGRGKDDRVVAAALAAYAWAEWRRPELKAQGHTYEYAQTVEEKGGEDQVTALWRRFLKDMKIKMPDEI